MTIIEAIDRMDSLKPNGYSFDDKVNWLSSLDGMVLDQVLANYITDEEKNEFEGYNPNTPIDTKLLVDEPYSDIYLLWIQSKIEFYDGEIARYNNTMIAFNSLYNDFEKHIFRTRGAKETSIKYW